MTSLMSQEERLIQQGGFAETVVKAATACNQLMIDNCGLCTVYCDKQVQYESVLLEQYKITGSLEGLFSKLDNSIKVQVCRDDLFDEDSVVDQVNSRTEDE
jgi:aldehyde:ferredoxin oxidoreductase